jgi:hypothetical protein
MPGQGVPGQAGVPGQTGVGQYPGQPGVPGHGGVPGQPGVPGQTGVAGATPGQPATNPDGSIPTPAGADGKAVIHDGDLTITAQQGKVPGEVQVSIDDGTGKPPHTYTIDYNNSDGPTASPTHPAGTDPSGIGNHPTTDHAVPNQPIAADGQRLAHDASPLGHDPAAADAGQPVGHEMAGTGTAGWTAPEDTPVSTGPAHALPDDAPMPEPVAWTAPAATDAGTFDFAPSGQHDQGSFSGSLFDDAPASTTVAAAAFTTGAHVDTGGTSAWTLGGGTGHDMIGDQGGGLHHSAWDTAHSASAPGLAPTDQASAPGDAGLAQMGSAHPAAGQAGAPMGGMPMMGAMGGGGHGGAGEDQERSTNAAWRTPSAVFDDSGQAGVSRMNGVLGDDEGSPRQ